jgi:VanZ family protein
MKRVLGWAAVFRAAAWGCVALIAVLSLLPAEEMVRTGVSGRVEHVVAYAGTALLAGLGYRDRGLVRVAAALVAYAAAMELLQDLSPGRRPAVGDWLAGSAGVLLGIWVARLAPVFAPRGAAASRWAVARYHQRRGD